MLRTSVRAASLSLLVVACGSSNKGPEGPTSSPVADTCASRLSPRAAPLEVEPPPPAPPPPTRASRLVTNVELRLATLSKELETRIGPRLAEERGKGIGVAGHLNYTVDRGPFKVTVEGDALVVRTDVRSHAEACRGNGCYASCDPEGRATATVPLRLTPDYRFPPSRVTFAFTRGCAVRALGGMLKIDVTPTIQSQLQPSLRRVEQEIDGKLPPLRPQAERLWNEVQKTRSLPLGMCVVPSPRGIVQGPASGTPDALRVRFGLVAYPEIRTGGCAPDGLAPKPLPPLAQDPSLPAEDDLVLAIVSPLATMTSGLAGSSPVDAGPGRARIASANGAPAGSLARVELGLAGEVCGDLAVRSALAWTDDVRSLRLASPTLPGGEAARATQAGLVPDTFLRSLGAARMAPALAPDALKELVPTLVSSMSDPTLDVSAKVSQVKAADVTVRGEDVLAGVLVRGSVELRQR